MEKKKGLYANIHAKRKRIERGSGERMRKPGSKGAPTEQDFKDAAKTVKEERMSKGMTIEDIAEKHGTSIKAIELEIEKGLKVEKEHTDSEAEAKRIAMDHLVEIPDYYTRLLKMEKEAKNEGVRITKSRQELLEKKKKKSTATARDYNAKAMWGRVKAQTFKAKKGAGSYTRKKKHKGIYENLSLTEGAANFSSMGGDLPLLVWLDYDTVWEKLRDRAQEEIYDELGDEVNNKDEGEIQSLIDERLDNLMQDNDTAILDGSQVEELQSDIDEFNSKIKNKFELDGDVVTIRFGYYDGAQLYANPDYLTPEQLQEVEEFFELMKEKYYLTELGSGGQYGYPTIGKGQGLDKMVAIGDEDLEEALMPPDEELVEKFLKLLKDNGYTVESVKRGEVFRDEEQVHIQIKSSNGGFTEETFEEEFYRITDIIDEFDKERKNHITYNFGLTTDGYVTAGLDLRSEYLGPETMVTIDTNLEESKDIATLGKPTRNDLKKATKRHKKTDKKGARGWFVNPNAGLVKVAIDKFNARTPVGSSPMPSIGTQYTAPADGGSASSSMGVGSAPAGLGEAMLTEKVEKHEVLNPKFWEGNTLKPEVKGKILEIVKTFVEGLEKDNIKIKVKDIILIGSNASYNYSDTSDLDVHIIADTEGLECPEELYPLLYSSYRSIFNKKYDIEFYGTGVELFVDTEDTKTVSNGIYSLNTGWIKEPVKEDIPELDEERFNTEFTKWEDRYFELIRGEELSPEEKPIQDITESMKSDKIKQIDDYVEDIYDLRKLSLQKDGEYSIGNLVFKEMRALGYLDNLKQIKNNIKSRELSLTEALEEGIIDTKEKIDKLAKMVKEDGTYTVDKDGKPQKQELKSGFQVSFFRPEITDADIKLILEVIGKSFGQQYLGLFQGSGEISYTLESSLAKAVARIFNQYSIWNNEAQVEEKNVSFDEQVKVDYKKAAKELAELLGK